MEHLNSDVQVFFIVRIFTQLIHMGPSSVFHLIRPFPRTNTHKKKDFGVVYFCG